MWDWHPEPEDTVVWKGACHAGLPTARARRSGSSMAGRSTASSATYRDGKREGAGHYVWNENVRFEGLYANDVPQGYGVAQIEGDVVGRRVEQGLPQRGWEGRGDRRAARVLRPGWAKKGKVAGR